jgi:hypothetical protein
MKKLALLNYEGNIMECRIIKGSDLYLLVILLNDNGYINFIPTAKDMYSYLMGRCTVNEMIKGSKKIHVNNICKSPNEIDYKNIHSGEKRITDHSEEDLCIENISKIKEILEKTLLKSGNSVTINKKGYRRNNRYNKYISPRNSNDSVPNEETIMQIDSIVTSISKMDSLALYSCLDEDIEYMNMCMYRFLALLHKKFENFKTKGDTGLFITKGKCGGCFTGSEGIGFKFTGNNTGDDWSLLFKIQKHHLIDIFECYNFKDAGPNNYKF